MADSGKIVTGDAVLLAVRVAQLPTRFIAFVLDAVLIVGLYLALTYLAGLASPGSNDAAMAAVTLTCLVMAFVAFPTAVETFSHGRSTGKALMGLRVVRDDGGPTRMRHAFVRALVGIVDFWLTSGIVAVFTSISNERGKRLGDLLAGTVVVSERGRRREAPMPPMPAALSLWASTLELSRLPDPLALSARTYATRMGELAPDVSQKIGHELASEVATYVSPQAPPGTPAWAYLLAVLNERTRRALLATQSSAQPQIQPPFQQPLPPPLQRPLPPPLQRPLQQPPQASERIAIPAPPDPIPDERTAPQSPAGFAPPT